MKTINWDKCKNPGVFGKYDPKKGKFGKVPDAVTILPNMEIDVKYKDCTIFLTYSVKFQYQIQGKVKDIRTSGHGKPEDLSIGDEVLIDREFICPSFPNRLSLDFGKVKLLLNPPK
jgi:hypothetical protein